MSGLSGLYFLDSHGKSLIGRTYRSEVPSSLFEVFEAHLLCYDDTKFTPIFLYNEFSFLHITINNVIILAISNENINTTMVFALLYKIKEVLIDYFENVEIESIQDNFVLIHELLDEMIDNGYPQILDSQILKQFIHVQALKLSKKIPEIPKTIMEKASWRKDNVFYYKNEIFLEVFEDISMTLTKQGIPLCTEINGKILCKSMLSGSPHCKLKLNDVIILIDPDNEVRLSDVRMHQCVDLTEYHSKRVIRFIPPDGDFELLSYRITQNFPSLFSIDLNYVNKSSSILEFQVTIGSNFKSECLAQNVKIHIPVACDVQKPIFEAFQGYVEYEAEKDCVVWYIDEFEGISEFSMTAKFKLPSIASGERENYKKMPLELEFEIPYYTVSGIQVKDLKITEKEGYEAVPWVKYTTKNGKYLMKINE